MKISATGIHNAAEALGRVAKAAVKGDEVLVDKATKQKRLSICEGCSYLDGMQCSLCECLVRAKVLLATEQCPKGNW